MSPKVAISNGLGFESIKVRRSSARVFVSYHHSKNVDQVDGRSSCAKLIKLLNANGMEVLGRSVQEFEIGIGWDAKEIKRYIADEYLDETNVTIVLIGRRTWQRKFVDWEIRASLHKKSGLIGIFLPSHPNFALESSQWDFGTVPPLLADNCIKQFPYGTLHKWEEDPEVIKNWVQGAMERSKQIRPELGRPPIFNNLRGARWNLRHKHRQKLRSP
jgi:MTH538 TIR-like domain (DUF1863)